MINKDQFLEFALSKFTQFGSKRFTLDELANEMGISKKTIYENFTNKEAVVQESLVLYLNKVRSKMNESVEREKSNPILAVIAVCRIGLDSLKNFSPAFLFGLRKYYPKVDTYFNHFRTDYIHTTVRGLLLRAQELGHIKKDININLICQLYLERLHLLIFTEENLFEKFSIDELLDNFIAHNLRGLATISYLEKNDHLL
ncbi:TetR/AcrR family transcriptional regulator [Zobellia amurskyensis]|uniref:TetR/AcrR family transcriptional regulator n=1 Tax=Zobellia amurskyensis TaxID=248905 RepID=A0A7X2ZSW5_9FLAO|nr:TetR/AcrR family transcriptional regulator [Zobellia amurskyensis]MUH35769.1 TetR/AcrR family transcriptional regulator [Zobellia amurskyensis]